MMETKKYTVSKEMHIRKDVPQILKSNLAGVLYPGFIIDAIGEEFGEPYTDKDNGLTSNIWLKDVNGFYYWKGGVRLPDVTESPIVLPANKEWWFDFLQIERLWTELGTQGEGVSVAVWDTGFDNRRGTIKNIERISGENFFSEDPATRLDLTDIDPKRHGTEIARLIAGDSVKMGVAPACNLVIGKCVNQQTRQYKFKEFIHSELFEKADIINMSYAFLASADQELVDQITDLLKNNNKIIIAAMGNYGSESTFKTLPATLESVIGVNPLKNEQFQLVDIATKVPPDSMVTLVAPGDEIKSVFFSDSLKGTSFACAIVSGICAVLISYLKRENIPYSPAKIKLLLETACVYNANWNKQLYGNGVLNCALLIDKIKQTLA